ncbi:winged helix DNA-binding domain-containing protein [Actinokineospora sp. HUAS TT18]|uniref:winged helix DNA-binding domain-containing protein n=1 Tax=Actinokineospora sp. HUAS TT18 TaxID=3447451 RepID=UPI003F51CCC4
MKVLSLRALNRATLARQLLIERADLDVPTAVEHLVGLQAQTPHTWYVGLWSRLRDFTPDQASDLLESRELVRIVLMRGTIHLVTAADSLRLRPLLAPMLARALNGVFGRGLVGVDRDELLAAGRAILEDNPLIFSDLGKELAKRWPDNDPASLAQAVRAWTPLVQVTPRGLWGRPGAAAHTTVEHWLGGREVEPIDLAEMVRRYLAAFGPASVKDVQLWSGLTRLSEVVKGMDLIKFTDEQGRELFDLPDAPRPDADTPVPIRFLYDFDNLLLSHADRSRVITDLYRAQDFDPHGPVPRVILIDGVTAGLWTTEVAKDRVVFKGRGLGKLTKAQRSEIETEAAGLLRFLAPASEHDIQVA